MMKKISTPVKAKYIRRGSRIKNMEDDTTRKYSSNNEAKRASRKIQLEENGSIGKGVLEVFKDEAIHNS